MKQAYYRKNELKIEEISNSEGSNITKQSQIINADYNNERKFHKGINKERQPEIDSTNHEDQKKCSEKLKTWKSKIQQKSNLIRDKHKKESNGRYEKDSSRDESDCFAIKKTLHKPTHSRKNKYYKKEVDSSSENDRLSEPDQKKLQISYSTQLKNDMVNLHKYNLTLEEDTPRKLIKYISSSDESLDNEPIPEQKNNKNRSSSGKIPFIFALNRKSLNTKTTEKDCKSDEPSENTRKSNISRQKKNLSLENDEILLDRQTKNKQIPPTISKLSNNSNFKQTNYSGKPPCCNPAIKYPKARSVKNNTFRDMVINSNLFVDKTMFIKEIITTFLSGIIITRPRRWGKSVNLDMLKTFLQPELDENGVKCIEQSINNTKLFQGGTVIINNKVKELKKLKISSDEIFKYQGRVPVIFIKFSNIEVPDSVTVGDIKLIFADCISKAYRDHIYIYNSFLKDLDESKNKEEYQNYVLRRDIKIFQRYLFQEEKALLCISLSTLVDFLYKYFNEKVYVLIDDYDAPLISSIGKPYYKMVESIIETIFTNGFKDTGKVRKCILTGLLPLSFDSIFHNSCYFRYSTVLDLSFSSSFGFNQEEFDLLAKATIKFDKHKFKAERKKIKSWYKGYNIGGETIYNPWSIIQCLTAYSQNSSNCLTDHWGESFNITIIKRCFDRLHKSEDLDVLLYTGTLKYPIRNNFSLGNHQTEIICFAILLHEGYLTRDEDENYYRIANLEARICLLNAVSETWMRKNKGLHSKEHVVIFTKELAASLANSEQYIDIMSRYIDNVRGCNKGQIQGFLRCSIIFACLEEIPNHKVFSIYPNIPKSRVDQIFIPIDELNGALIVHKHKKTINKNLNNEEIFDILESACWKVYTQEYLSTAIKIYSECENKLELKYVSVRSMLVNELNNNRWKLKVMWFDHTIEQANYLVKVFSDIKRRIKFNYMRNILAYHQKCRKLHHFVKCSL